MKGEMGPIAGAFIAIVAVSLIGGLAFLGLQSAETTQPTVEADGEFDQALLAHSNLESPLKSMNGFQNITVNSDASTGQADVLDQANITWDVSASTDLGLEERKAVAHFETDGALDEVEVELTDETSGTNYDGGVSLQSVDFYDYEAAVDQDSLSAGEMGVEFKDVDGTSAEAEVGSLTEGEYAVVPTYKFDSGETAPSADTVDTLSELNVDADTEGDVDAISGLGIRTYTT